tara:strand:+ start:23808 stop:26102 length:2295 start_codon:yes stop_codon:yes gene_type:complete
MASSYVKEKHDIGILRSDGTTKVGLMMARDKNDIPRYSMYAKKKLTDQYFTGLPDYGYQDPEEEVPISQDDWRSGLGLEIADSDDPKRYHKSTTDMRFKGKAISGTKSTAIYGTSGWRSPTGFTDPNTRWTNEESAYDEDTATKATGSRIGAGNISIYLSIESTSCDSVRYYVTNGTQPITNLKIEVYYSAGWNTILDAMPTLGAWTTVAIGSTQDVTNANLTFTVNIGNGTIFLHEFDYNIAGNCSLGAAVTKSDFNDHLYIGRLTELWKVDKTAGTISYIRGFPANISSLAAFSDSRLYIAIGNSDAYWYMDTAEAFTESTAAVTDFKYFAMVNAATPVLWGSDGVNTIRSNTNPINGGAAWSGQTTVDTSFHSITKLLSRSGALYIMKENRPYYLNSAGAVQSDLAPELEALKASTDNGKNAVVWLNKLYMHWGEQSLLEEDSGTNTWRSPALFCTDASEYNGVVFAIAGDDQYLYAIVDNSASIEVLAGRLETIDGTTDWVWHCINETTLTGCEAAWVSSVYQKRLWISSTTSTEDLYYLPLPIGYADVVNDTNRSFPATTHFDTPWLHGGFKNTEKAFTEITLTMGHSYDAAIGWTVHYQIVGDTIWTSIGNFLGSATSMTQTRYIPADISGNNPVSTMMRLRFYASTDDSTITPILLNFLLKAVLYPGQRDIIVCSVKCSDELVLKDGTIDRGSRDNTIAVIDEAREATWPVTIYDIDGNTQTVKFLPANPLFVVTKVEKGRVIESEYNLILQKVALS